MNLHLGGVLLICVLAQLSCFLSKLSESSLYVHSNRTFRERSSHENLIREAKGSFMEIMLITKISMDINQSIPVLQSAPRTSTDSSQTALTNSNETADCSTTRSDSLQRGTSLSMNPLLSLSLSRGFLSCLSGKSDTFNLFPSLRLDEMTADDSQSLQFCLQQVDQELQPLQQRQSKMPSLPMDEFTFQLSPRNEQESDDPFLVNLFLSPSDRGFSELKGSLSISRHPSLSFATNFEKPEAAHGPLSSGWIRNVTASVIQSNNEQPCNTNAKLPFSGTNAVPMFDTPFIPCATDTESDGNPYSGSMSDLSSFDDSVQKKQSTKNRKKWICSNCRYYNNLSFLPIWDSS